MAGLIGKSYHDLYITTSKIKRTRLFNMPYGYEIICNRIGGWQLVMENKIIAGEYDKGLRLDINGHIFIDSLTKEG